MKEAAGREGRRVSSRDAPVELAGVVQRNIRALLAVRRESDQRRSPLDRLASRLTHFAGSVPALVLLVLLFSAWFLANLGLMPGIRSWDPYPFGLLAVSAAVGAILLTTVVLISQNRLTAHSEKRSDLDLQMSLLAEHEITRLIHMVDAIATHLGVCVPGDGQVEELKQDVPPERVLQELEDAEEEWQAEVEPAVAVTEKP